MAAEHTAGQTTPVTTCNVLPNARRGTPLARRSKRQGVFGPLSNEVDMLSTVTESLAEAIACCPAKSFGDNRQAGPCEA
jgi:hypothetical protein